MRKRPFVMLLVLMLIINMMPIQVFAEVSEGSSAGYDSVSGNNSDSLPGWAISAGLMVEDAGWDSTTSTLTFLRDITLQKEVTIPAEAGKVIIDLNGYDITDATYQAFVVDGAEVDFNDSAEVDGTVSAVNFVIYVKNGIANIYGGTYLGEDAINIGENGTVNVYGGNICGKAGRGRGIVNSGTLLITGGTISGSEGWSAVCAGNNSTVITGGNLIEGNAGTIEYYGGTLDLSQYAQVEGMTIKNRTEAEISVGTSGTSILLPESGGYWLTDEDGTEITAIPAQIKATIVTDEKLPDWATQSGLTIQTASWNSSTNTLTFLQDVTVSQEICISALTDQVTIDLNGCNVTGDDVLFLIDGVQVDFKDSAEVDGVAKASDRTICVYAGAANIYGGTYEGQDVVELWELGTLTMYDGTLNCTEATGRAISNFGNLLVKGGTVNGGYGWSAIYADGPSTVIEGGTLNTGEDAMIEYLQGTLDLSGYADVEGVTIRNCADTEVSVGTSGTQILLPEGYVCKLNNNEVCTSIPVEKTVSVGFPPTEHKITIVSTDTNGTISVSPEGDVFEGKEVFLTAKPAEGYRLQKWIVKDANGNDVAVYNNMFIMPASDVTVSAVFEEKITGLYVGGVFMKEGDYLAVGAAEVSDTAPATGGYAHLKNGTLTLNNFTYEGEGYYCEDGYGALIYGETDFEIVLQGKNQLSNSMDEYGDGIVAWADVTISGTEGASLEISASNTGIHLAPYVDDEGYKLIIQNAVLDIHTVYSEGIDSNGVIEIIDSQFSINSESDECIYLYDVYNYGLDDYIPAELTITGSTLDLYNEDEEAIYAYGYVTIEDSVITAECQKEAIDVAYDLEIKDSTLDLAVTDIDYDGIVADESILIEDSSVSIDAGIDGINSYNGSITISGSDLAITAGQGGIIAYGELSMTDSELTVDAPFGLYIYETIFITDSDVVINAEECGVYAGTEDLNIVNSNLDVTTVSYEAVAAYGDINLTETVIVTPVNGQIITEESNETYIADAEGNMAYHVVLHAHRYGEAEFTWTKTAGNYTATAVKECECGHVAEGTVAVTSEITTTANCMTIGVRTYTAKATFEDGTTEESTEEEKLSLGGHVSGNSVEQNRVQATCTEKGSYDKVTYCAVCKTHEISRVKCEIPATGHTDANKDNHCDMCNAGVGNVPKSPSTGDTMDYVLWMILVSTGLSLSLLLMSRKQKVIK